MHVPVRVTTAPHRKGGEGCRDLSGIAAKIADSRGDWPGRPSTTVLLSGCELSCPYCFSPEHIGRRQPDTTIDQIVESVRSRGNVEGVVVSGGEPTSSTALLPLLEALREVGLPIKLDTNGAAPQTLTEVLNRGLVTFVSLDVKTTPDRYDRLTRGRDVWSRVENSIDLVLESGVDHEFRTTCYPFAVSAADLPKMASRLGGGRRYVLQQFAPRRTLDPAAATVSPISAHELRRAAIGCSVHLPTIVRGV